MARQTQQQGTATARKRSSSAISDDAIALLAYELFERRGRIDGHDQQDWFEAEQMLQQHQPSRRQR